MTQKNILLVTSPKSV